MRYLDNFLRGVKKPKNFLKNQLIYIPLILMPFFYNSCKPEEEIEPQQETTKPTNNNPDNNSDDDDVNEPSDDNSSTEQKTFVLTQDEMDNIISYDGTEIYFNSPTDFNKGDYISAEISKNTPEGLLRKITVASSDKKIFITTQASLPEAVENGSISKQIIFKKDMKKSSAILPYGITLTNGLLEFNYHFENYVLYDFDGNLATTNDQIILNGDFSFDLSLFFDLDIAEHELKKFSVKYIINEKSNINIYSNIYKTIDEEKTLFEIPFSPFVLGYMGVPIVVVPKIECVAGIDGEIYLNASTNFSQEFYSEAGIVYESGNWKNTCEKNFDISASEPILNYYANFKATTGIKGSLNLYGVAGPYVIFGAYGELSTTLTKDNFNQKIDGGLEFLVGAEMNILSKTLLNHREKLFSHNEVLFEQNIPLEESPSANLDSIVIQPDADEGKDAYVKKVEWPNGTTTYSGFGDETYLNVRTEDLGRIYEEALMEMDCTLPSDFSELSSAYLMLYGQGAFGADETVTIKARKLLGAWEESSVAYNTKPNYSDESISTTIGAGGQKWHKINITSFVKDWIDGEPNYGIALTCSSNRPCGEDLGFKSSDYSNSEFHPKLVIYYEK